MASFNNSDGGSSNSSSFDSLLLQSLMGRLQLRPPYLDTNSYLSQSLEDFVIPHHDLDFDDDGEEEEEEEDEEGGFFFFGGGGVGGAGGGREQRSLLAREEAKLEKEVIRIIHSGNAREALKPNSGQSVAIGDHHICVGFHEEPRSGYRVWEWHGHVMLFDDDHGYSPEYIYGNYFERLPKDSCSAVQRQEDERVNVEEDNDDGDAEEGSVGDSGLKDLIGGDNKVAASTAAAVQGRVLHRRNSLSAKSG